MYTTRLRERAKTISINVGLLHCDHNYPSAAIRRARDIVSTSSVSPYVCMYVTLSLFTRVTRSLEKYCSEQLNFVCAISGLLASTSLHLDSVAVLGVAICRVRKSRFIVRTPNRYGVQLACNAPRQAWWPPVYRRRREISRLPAQVEILRRGNRACSLSTLVKCCHKWTYFSPDILSWVVINHGYQAYKLN